MTDNMQTKITYCRICEALCGLEVDVVGERIVDVRPDPKHPVSAGFACVKGVGLGGLHHDPDRLNHPMKRVAGKLEPISWDQATREIGDRLKAIAKAHGPRSLALYTGNPTFFNFKGFFFAEQFVDALGTPNLFASHSIDCNNKFFVAQEMYGLPTVHPVVDFEHVRFLMVLGGNPAVSQMSFVNAPNAIRKLKAITKRGGRVVIVDPRRSETAEQVGEHLPIRPGTDAYLLAAMAHVVIGEGLWNRAVVAQSTSGFETLQSVVQPWSPERVASVTGITAEQIRSLARGFAAAEGAALYMSTGVNMGPFGSIAYWMLQALNIMTGNVDRRGGLLQPRGPFDLLRLTSLMGLGRRGRRTRDGRFSGVVDALPAGALADEIAVDGPDRVRALIVSAGNPVHSIPGARLEEAFKRLDLLVCIDIYPNETAAFADYVLPATDMLERSDTPITLSLNQTTPYAQYTQAVVQPAHERREEWRIFSDLALAMGKPMGSVTLCHLFGGLNHLLERVTNWRLSPDFLLTPLLGLLGDVSMDELRSNPHGVLLPPVRPGSFLGKRVRTPDRKVNLAPAPCLADLPRFAREEPNFAPRAGQLLVIGRREKRSHNSWMHNNRGVSQPAANSALVHPDDAARAGVRPGETIRVHGNGHSIELPVKVSDTVCEGVVVIPHGWGHGASGLTRARELGGANVNQVIPGGLDALEPVSGQAIMVGTPVRLERVAPGE